MKHNNKIILLLTTTFSLLFLLMVSFQSSAVPNGDYEPPIPDPEPETRPNPPSLTVIWKDASAVKLQWWDRSLVEYGYKLRQMNSSGGWDIIGDFQALNSSNPRDFYTVNNLNPNSRYCFQAIAYNNYGYSGPAQIQQSCVYTASVNSCPGAVIESILTPATSSDSWDSIYCDINFEPGQIISKRLVFHGSDASNVTVDLNGAALSGKGTINDGSEMITIKSRESVVRNTANQLSSYDRPTNITIKNGSIYGKIRVWGMSRNGEGDEEKGIAHSNQFKKSSRLFGHTQRARQNAPTNIVFDNLVIDLTGTFYIGPGVTFSKILNSELRGNTSAAAIYLDTESDSNTIKNNYIHVVTADDKYEHIPWFESRGWPLIGIDASRRNKIINNRFSSLNNGGIYLYRNCGKNGVVRHSNPSYNHIINNVFYYNKYTSSSPLNMLKPSVYLSSRDYRLSGRLPFSSCRQDDGYPFGSSVSDRDFARFNVVMQNQIFKNPLWMMIRTKNRLLNSPNFIEYNQTVTDESVVYNRPAGCYVEQDDRGFMFDGQFFDIYLNANSTNRQTCRNGELTSQIIRSFVVPRINIPIGSPILGHRVN